MYKYIYYVIIFVKNYYYMGERKMKKNIRIGIVIGMLMATMIFPVMGSACQQTPTNVTIAAPRITPQSTSSTTLPSADWAVDVNGDDIIEAQGQMLYTLERGIAGRIIKISGTWETNDGNMSGSLTVKNFVFSKFYGTYRGLCIGNITGDYYTAKFVGYFYNDWEIGRWTIFSLFKIKVYIVHIPFN
jgi:hypothetical protein